MGFISLCVSRLLKKESEKAFGGMEEGRCVWGLEGEMQITMNVEQ